MGDISVLELTKDDGPAVAEHLQHNFCVHEPILNYLKVGIDQNFLKMCVSLIDQGLSLKAIDENGQIAGIFIAELKQRAVKDHDGFFQLTAQNADSRTFEDSQQEEKIRIVDGILRYMDQSVDLFGTYPDIDCYLDAAILSVNSDFRGRGVGSKLFNGLIDLCKAKGIPFIKTFCSSKFTSKICKKSGLKQVYEIYYRDIPLDQLTAPDIPEPHAIARLFIGDLRV